MTTLEESMDLPHTSIRTARIAVATVFFVNGTLIANWLTRIPDIKDRLGLSTSVLGFALLMTAVGALIAQPTSGWIIGRLGSRTVTTTMGLLYCVSVIPLGYAPNLPLLMLALFVMGACNGALDVAMNSQAALVEKAYKRSIMNSFHGLWSVGALAGAGMGGIAVAWHISIGTHLLTMALVGLIVMLITIRYLVADRGTQSGEASGFVVPPLVLLPMGVVAFFVLFCEGAIGDWSTIYSARRPWHLTRTSHARLRGLFAAHGGGTSDRRLADHAVRRGAARADQRRSDPRRHGDGTDQRVVMGISRRLCAGGSRNLLYLPTDSQRRITHTRHRARHRDRSDGNGRLYRLFGWSTAARNARRTGDATRCVGAAGDFRASW